MSNDLEHRLNRLERQERYHKYSILIGVALLIFTLVIIVLERRSKSFSIVTAGGFEVVDSKGRKRAILGLTDKEQPYLSITDLDSSKHVLISIFPKGRPFMILGDNGTYQHLSLFGPAPGSAGAIDFTYDAKHLIELQVSSDGLPSLTLRDKDEKTLWKAP